MAYGGSDTALIDRLMTRDESALREVIDLYGGIVNGMARRVVGDTAMAEEVAQDAFVTLWRRPGAFDPDRGSLKTFLTTVARNKAVDLIRREEANKRKKDALIEEMKVEPATSGFDGDADRRAEIHDALGRLSGVQREAITLAYFGGRTYREVADELGIAEGTAKTRLRDGLKKLRTVLADARDEANDD
ncbi:MAG TPA: sigma-70 family RNA polymerase sigma factor [Actinomycetota bacterium]|nr:sigma-70 family RNA polymerase sigma factor [Actinomycetota bacterium]